MFLKVKIGQEVLWDGDENGRRQKRKVFFQIGGGVSIPLMSFANYLLQKTFIKTVVQNIL